MTLLTDAPVRAVQTAALSRPQASINLSAYTLFWRQRQLLVEAGPSAEPMSTSVSVAHAAYLADCLKRSSVQLVRLSQDLGEVALRQWADAAQQAGKAVFLKVPSATCLPKQGHPFAWQVKCLLDRLVAALFLAILSPVLLLIALMIRVSSPGPIFFKQWRVGERGRLFQIIKFRTMVEGAEALHHQVMGDQVSLLHKQIADPRVTSLGAWLRKYSLDELPQLLNVLWGDMSLVGPRPWALYDAIRIPSDARKRLNALPGITGFWQVAARSTLLDLQAVSQYDLDYLNGWSLLWDLRILLLTIPKVLSGSGAY